MIRRANFQDKITIENLIELFPSEVQSNLKLELRQALEGLVEGIVCTENEFLQGYMTLRKWGGVYWLDTLAVDPGMQRRGIGKSLVEYAKTLCKTSNTPQLNVCTFIEKNHSFYENLGFIKMGELDGPFMPLDRKRTYLKWVNPNFNR